MREAVICEAVRTPIGRRKGALADVHPVDLSAHVLNAVLERTGLTPADVDDVLWGCVTQLGDQSGNVGRFAVLAAGWPESVPGVTINRACGSSHQAIEFAAMGVMSGRYDLAVAGGVESMTRVPLGATRAVGEPYGPGMRERYPDSNFEQGPGAEQMAVRWSLSRRDIDEFSLASHEKAAAATDAGAFNRQLAPLPAVPELRADEGIRRDSTLEKLAALSPAFQEDGVVTAGNASQISDGAAAVVVTTPEKARELGLTPLVRLHTGVVAADDPVMVLSAPIPATRKLLQRSGVSLDEIGVYEVNEAFATVPVAWLAETGADPARLNPLGGAIAVGHPLGASGAILMTRMIHHMRDNGIRYGLQTICEAGGTANATLVELVADR
ncbi:acetyl-CoA C-acyltransferase [Amycolatopsis rubida]|uniref:Acetyl-CoA C-acyltransferase n=1 Tax=Amycolatopsis rubida TaxID=112413 RepID=A0ABX0C7Y2_9PSEU|nr:acetyl-CoA C-acyltransferase [Amycolatopsis sp. M39]MYW96130.1 acetyl-CoA C-acyltransferase [Amycolatopsis rubida]NEC61121.1 acetyl-CoA C-acyltransferase [Amycolatopsis rubida]OAP23356.1 3-ketoacyl-CoA thiolase [Amycolatopsis sp. M39]